MNSQDKPALRSRQAIRLQTIQAAAAALPPAAVVARPLAAAVALPALRRATDDPREYVRNAALNAIERIEDDLAPKRK